MKVKDLIHYYPKSEAIKRTYSNGETLYGYKVFHNNKILTFYSNNGYPSIITVTSENHE